ncbi:hypothetical protein [Bradyrhizobium sp. ORS 86]
MKVDRGEIRRSVERDHHYQWHVSIMCGIIVAVAVLITIIGWHI